MIVRVNGNEQKVESGTTLADLVGATRGDASGKGTAAAVNGEVVKRSEWPTTRLSEGDRVEVLAASQGG
ncbi:MAG: sulfur carrier protein ThiS [Actinobacteria bacterium]|nr:sulfur carrier protein ThiS [Actinomycetota bacterium]